MDELHKLSVATLFARKMLKFHDTINGLTVMSGVGVLSVEELCEVGRAAIALIEEGKVK